MSILLLSILLGLIVLMLVKRKDWFESVGFLRWWPNTWQGFVVVGLFIFFGVVSIYSFDTKKAEDEAIRASKQLQSSIPALQGEGLIYFRNDLKCKKLHYLATDGRTERLFADPLDSVCGNSEHEMLFAPEAKEKFDSISHLVASEDISEIQTTWSFGEILAAAFYRECDGVCNPTGYVFNPEGAIFPLDRSYLDLIGGKWYAMRYHPSPF